MTDQQVKQAMEVLGSLGVHADQVFVARNRLMNLVLDDKELTDLHPVVVASAALEVAAMLNAVLAAQARVAAEKQGVVVNQDVLFTSLTNSFGEALNRSFSTSFDAMKEAK